MVELEMSLTTSLLDLARENVDCVSSANEFSLYLFKFETSSAALSLIEKTTVWQDMLDRIPIGSLI